MSGVEIFDMDCHATLAMTRTVHVMARTAHVMTRVVHVMARTTLAMTGD